jgi:hypothetical protein
MISKKSNTCWKVLTVLRLMVPRPESVMALTTKKRASMNRTLRAGVLAPQKMTAEIRQVSTK